MMRVRSQAYHEAMAAALAVLPSAFRSRASEVDLVAGVSPLFVGLHDYKDASYGRSYSDTMHVAWLHNQRLPAALRKTTVCIPGCPADVAELVHELGHVVHEWFEMEPELAAVTTYAQDDQYEAFAEAFTAHYLPGYLPWDYRDYAPEAPALFATLESAVGF